MTKGTFQMKLRQEKLDRAQFCFGHVHGKQNWYQDVPGTSTVQE